MKKIIILILCLTALFGLAGCKTGYENAEDIGDGFFVYNPEKHEVFQNPLTGSRLAGFHILEELEDYIITFFSFHHIFTRHSCKIMHNCVSYVRINTKG